jgi:hypothetical protein
MSRRIGVQWAPILCCRGRPALRAAERRSSSPATTGTHRPLSYHSLRAWLLESLTAKDSGIPLHPSVCRGSHPCRSVPFYRLSSNSLQKQKSPDQAGVCLSNRCGENDWPTGLHLSSGQRLKPCSCCPHRPFVAPSPRPWRPQCWPPDSQQPAAASALSQSVNRFLDGG